MTAKNVTATHRVDVRQVVGYEGRNYEVFEHVPVCVSCGWKGLPVPTSVAAWDRAKAHKAEAR